VFRGFGFMFMFKFRKLEKVQVCVQAKRVLNHTELNFSNTNLDECQINVDTRRAEFLHAVPVSCDGLPSLCVILKKYNIERTHHFVM
jgi:hypothetical protein